MNASERAIVQGGQRAGIVRFFDFRSRYMVHRRASSRRSWYKESFKSAIETTYICPWKTYETDTVKGVEEKKNI